MLDKDQSGSAAKQAATGEVNKKQRLVYIRQRLLEIRDERERLLAERNLLKPSDGK